ncbi:ankyrin repeat-containing domain protein [Chaetomium tenue]|uniref:Ankyrin repeat-containing domain protein n=1 Tax=Chaetomium tenue TaxID=1854479 RepID=A0ACB7NWY4_9PEZI|nr:ankyrin repeat-containing domain protein [Chaetomium globosum]
MVTALLDAGVGVDINRPDTDGWAALHYAAHEGSEAVARALMLRGVSTAVTTRCWGGSGGGGLAGHRPQLEGVRRDEPWVAQPLHVAAISGKAGVVRLLVQHGVDVDARVAGTEHYGPTALRMALHVGGIGLLAEEFGHEYLEVAQALVEAGADVSGVADGFTMEHVLKFKGYEDLWDKLRVGILTK